MLSLSISFPFSLFQYLFPVRFYFSCKKFNFFISMIAIVVVAVAIAVEFRHVLPKSTSCLSDDIIAIISKRDNAEFHSTALFLRFLFCFPFLYFNVLFLFDYVALSTLTQNFLFFYTFLALLSIPLFIFSRFSAFSPSFS